MELRRFVKLFAVKPLLIIYAFQYTLQWTVSKYLPTKLKWQVQNLFSKNWLIYRQLWLDRTCLVNLGFNETVCKNLTQYTDQENQVQEVVSRLNIVGRYIGSIPSIIMTLLLGEKYNFCLQIFKKKIAEKIH